MEGIYVRSFKNNEFCLVGATNIAATGNSSFCLADMKKYLLLWNLSAKWTLYERPFIMFLILSQSDDKHLGHWQFLIGWFFGAFYSLLCSMDPCLLSKSVMGPLEIKIILSLWMAVSWTIIQHLSFLYI